MSRYNIALLVTGIVIGGCGWWFGDGPWAMASARTAHELYIQKPACRTARSNRLEVLHLRVTVPQAIIARTASLRVADPARPATIDLKIEGKPTPDQGGFIIYPNQFNQQEHRETWRPFCEFGRCAVSVNYHLPLSPASARLQHQDQITLSFADSSGQPIFQSVIRNVPGLWGIAAPDHLFPRLQGDPATTGAITIFPDAHDLETNLQTGLGANRQEQTAYLAARTQPRRLSVPRHTDPAIAYAGLYAASTDLMRQQIYETKLEWINRQDPFMACPEGENAMANGAAPATPSRPNTRPSAPQIPAAQK